MSLYDTKEELQEKRDNELKLARAGSDRIARMAAECFSTEAGKFMLNHLMHYCGYEQTSSVFHAVTGEVLPSTSAFNDGKRNVYTYIRSFLKTKAPQLLQETEFKTYK